MANPYFNNALAGQNKAEHALYNNATNEICEMFGRNFVYIPKTLVSPDWILGEDTNIEFSTFKTLTFFIRNVTGFGGIGDLYAKMGIVIDDRLDLVIQQNNFDNEIGSAPKIDDLIFCPVSKQLFNVNHVTYDDTFFQFLGESMTYRLSCTFYRYSHEKINTGISNLDILTVDTDEYNDINTSNEREQFTNKSNEILDFNADFFNNM